jgi:hypothetical protein
LGGARDPVLMQQIAVFVIVLGAALCFAMLAWAGQHRS